MIKWWRGYEFPWFFGAIFVHILAIFRMKHFLCPSSEVFFPTIIYSVIGFKSVSLIVLNNLLSMTCLCNANSSTPIGRFNSLWTFLSLSTVIFFTLARLSPDYGNWPILIFDAVYLYNMVVLSSLMTFIICRTALDCPVVIHVNFPVSK